ncbi:hypothetical protein LCGC14_0670830 [marine sediment metagenome]|uniref:Uncharacterized protein n=2 Tax=root TaxID=1 RepID=A0A831QVP1_9FLAO|nr:hypothetical protein [Pricia antarctica]
MKKSSKQKFRIRNRFIVESIAIILIALSPFMFKLHEYLPENPKATIQWFGMIFDRNGFLDLKTYGWFMLGKLVPLLLLTIWFLTCKHWWYHIILIPMMMYAFQIFETLYSEDKFIDTRNVLWLLPVCMVVIPIVYFIRIKLYDKYVHGIDLEAMEAEIKDINDKQGINKKDVKPVSKETSEEVGYKSLSEKVNEKLSTTNLESHFRQVQNQLDNWLHL